MPTQETLERFIPSARRVTSHCIRPVFLNRDYAVIRWTFSFIWLDGTTMHREELAYQRLQGEKIAEEQFFSDPSQREPK